MFWLAAIAGAAGVAGQVAGGISSSRAQRRAAQAEQNVSAYNRVVDDHNAYLQYYYAEAQAMANQSLLLSQAGMFDQEAVHKWREARRVAEAVRDNLQRTREDFRRFRGQQRAATAKSGVTSEGSPMAVAVETAARMENITQQMQYEAEVQKVGLRNEARVLKHQGAVARMQARLAGLEAEAAEDQYESNLLASSLRERAAGASASGRRAAARATAVSSYASAASSAASLLTKI